MTSPPKQNLGRGTLVEVEDTVGRATRPLAEITVADPRFETLVNFFASSDGHGDPDTVGS